jgi:hypothetical protein
MVAQNDEPKDDGGEPSPTTPTDESHAKQISVALGLIGAVIGGAFGYLGFFWIARQGFYALILPGTLMGLGCGLLSRRKMLVLGIVCAVGALALGVFAEWRFAPFIADRGFGYFLTHLHQLRPVTLILIGLGGVLGFWFGQGREPK